MRIACPAACQDRSDQQDSKQRQIANVRETHGGCSYIVFVKRTQHIQRESVSQTYPVAPPKPAARAPRQIPIPKAVWLIRLLRNSCVPTGPRAPNKPNPIAGNIRNQGNTLIARPNMTAGTASLGKTPSRDAA